MIAVRNKPKVLLALSGGIDSTVALAILQNKGYKVSAITFVIPSFGKKRRRSGPPQRPPDYIEHARRAARILGVAHQVVEAAGLFKAKVFDYFRKEYEAGRTPNPCIKCNQLFKFELLEREARRRGYDLVATGHYAKISASKGRKRFYIREACDRKKDQSYFLAFLPQRILAKTIFPLGGMRKKDVGAQAEKAGLKIENRKESQEICFIDGHYTGYLEGPVRGRQRGGLICDRSGAVLGDHDDIRGFTIGQRKGLGISHREPLYVTAIDRKTNNITVGTKKETMKRGVIVRDLHWQRYQLLNKRVEAYCKIRYGHKKAKASIFRRGQDELEVLFKKKQVAPTPGQAAVFYERGSIIGGGWIERVIDE